MWEGKLKHQSTDQTFKVLFAIMSNKDLIQIEKEMETSSTEFSEITEISESILSSKTECKYDFLCNKSNKIILKYYKYFTEVTEVQK